MASTIANGIAMGGDYGTPDPALYIFLLYGTLPAGANKGIIQ